MYGMKEFGPKTGLAPVIEMTKLIGVHLDMINTAKGTYTSASIKVHINETNRNA